MDSCATAGRGQTRAVNFLEIMQLEPHGADTYVGTGPAYPWGGLYGGQIVAQGLRATGHTVSDGFSPHSLHAYFIRPGDHTEPIRFEVERLRDGRSFCTRQVVARQSNGAILTMIASFHTGEESPTVTPIVAPDVPGPDGLEGTLWTPAIERRAVPTDGTETLAWLRIVDDLGPYEDDPILHCCGVAFASDDLPGEPVARSHPARPAGGWEDHDPEDDERLMVVSLDHALWFHRPMRADEWHLEDIDSSGMRSARGLGRGRFFDTEGNHVASVAQEVLVRTRRR